MKVSESTLKLICVLVAFPLTYMSLMLWISLFFSILSWSPIQFNIVFLPDFHSSDKNKINRGMHIWVDHVILWITHLSFASLETNVSLWVFPTGTWVWNITASQEAVPAESLHLCLLAQCKNCCSVGIQVVTVCQNVRSYLL